MSSGGPKFHVTAIRRNSVLVCQSSREDPSQPTTLLQAQAGRLLTLAECEELRQMLAFAIKEAATLDE